MNPLLQRTAQAVQQGRGRLHVVRSEGATSSLGSALDLLRDDSDTTPTSAQAADQAHMAHNGDEVAPTAPGGLTAAECEALDDLVRNAGAPKSPGNAPKLTAMGAAVAAAATPYVRPAGPLDPQAGVAMVNLSHFVAPLAGEMMVWREGIDCDTGARTVTPISMAAFRLEFANVMVDVPTPSGVKSMSVADIWLRSRLRREYPGGVVLQPEGSAKPGTYNLWQGFSVAPLAGDASPMVDHLEMMCAGDVALVEYVLNLLALCVQRPGTRPEVALVFRGGQGSGKGTAIRIMLAIFGRHGLHITQPRHLTGNFNSHLRNALFVFVDEGFWAGDKSAEGVLKGLITESTLTIEMKGQDVFEAPNRLKLVFASNNSWVVPAGADERRYCVVDVPNTRAQDHAYFGTLNAWIDGDGAAIFLHHLLNRDLSGFNVRAVPKTAALDRQKVEGMSNLDRFILDAADTGEGLAGEEWTEAGQRVRCEQVAARFEAYCRRSPTRGARGDTRTIGKRLAEVFGCGAAIAARFGTERGRAWVIPGITQARSLAATAFGLARYDWGLV